MKFRDAGVQRTVMVRGKCLSVNVRQKQLSIFVALGEYKGEMVEIEERSEDKAVRRWQDVAASRDLGQ